MPKKEMATKEELEITFGKGCIVKIANFPKDLNDSPDQIKTIKFKKLNPRNQ